MYLKVKEHQGMPAALKAGRDKGSSLESSWGVQHCQ